MSGLSIHRHAELVSASIRQPAMSVLLEKWTLKQVQGDGMAIALEGSGR
jgi:hypothetical protein